MKHAINSGLCLGLVFLLGCKLSGSSKSSSSPSSPQGLPVAAKTFLSNSDISPGQVSPITADALVQGLQSNSSLYNNQPKSNKTQPCIIDELNTARIHANTGAYVLNFDSDINDCASKTLNTSPNAVYTIKSSRLQALSIFMCPDLSLTGFNNKTAQALANVDLRHNCPHASALTQIDWHIVGTLAANGATNNFEAHNVVFSGSNNLDFCNSTMTNQRVTYDNNCIDVSRSDSAGYEEYQKASDNDVVEDGNNSAVWPISGNRAVTHNNWQGTVRYQGNASAPQANFNSANQQPISTTLNQQPGLTDASAETTPAAALRQALGLLQGH